MSPVPEPVHDETGLPEHLPMPVNERGQGPEDEAKAYTYLCWCGQGDRCAWNVALNRAFELGRFAGIGEAQHYDQVTRSLIEAGVRARAAEEIGRFVRTPPGVEASTVTQAYLHAAHVIVTGCVHDAWSPCPIQEGSDKRADFLRRHGVPVPESPTDPTEAPEATDTEENR